jgi:hypothetical protein
MTSENQSPRASLGPIAEQATEEVPYSWGRNLADNEPAQRSAANFGLFAEQIFSDVCASKGQHYICSPLLSGIHHDREKYQRASTWRLKHLIASTNFLVYDIDGFRLPEHLEHLVDYLERLGQYFAYTTASSTDFLPRLRVVISLTKALPSNKRIQLSEILQSKIEENIGLGNLKFDSSVYLGSQPWFTPTTGCKTFSSLEGAQINPDEWLEAQTLQAHKILESPRSIKNQEKIDPESIGKILTALSSISANIDRDQWRSVVWALASTNDLTARQLALEWSQSAPEKFDQRDFDRVWDSYDPSHQGAITLGTLFHIARDQKDATRSPDVRLPFDFNRFAIRTSAQEIFDRIGKERFAIPGIAIMGQSTVIYGTRNSGKTLIILRQICAQIKAGEINGETTYYVNADDNFRGIGEKLALAEDFGFKMIAPGWQDFEGRHLQELLIHQSKHDALNTIVIVDTLKKFTDVMDKRSATQWGKTARAFVQAGGTLIQLAHTNKHKDVEGKSVYQGTTDVIDDCDCAYILEIVADSEIERVVEFRNEKMRGDVASTLSFSYDKLSDYRAMFDSLRRVNQSEADQRRVGAMRQQQLDEDREIISEIRHLIMNGSNTTGSIVDGLNDQGLGSKQKIRKVLTRYELGKHLGGDPLWQSKTGAHGARIYSLI